MSGRTLRAALAEYLAVRRSLGFKLARDGLLLEQFVSFCERAGASRVTSELALAWVTAPPEASPGWLTMRLTVVRGFARWLQASDPATGVRPAGGRRRICIPQMTSPRCWPRPGGSAGRCRRPATRRSLPCSR